MDADLTSLFIIVVAAFVCPAISLSLPRRMIPETVFLLIAGMLLGPYVSNLVQSDAAIDLLSNLGLGFLFLLAGYEIDVRDISGKGGRHGLLTWFISFAAALAIAVPIGATHENIQGGFAEAIILTTTAYGTLVPIMHSRGITREDPIGKGITEYGVWGELCPVIALALLLTTRATWITVLLLLAFIAVSVIAGLVSKKLNAQGSKLDTLMKENAETNAQMSVRAVIILMVGLVTLSSLFDLDVVLGAFAAGFVLRVVIPKGDTSLEHKLNGIGYGFFIPLFFIVSGMKIDPAGVIADPIVLIVSIVALLFRRSVPIFRSCNVRRDMKDVDERSKGAIALYCATSLPLIVAVTSVAVKAGYMDQSIASALIAAGAITVFLMPLLATVVMHTIDADLGEACREIRRHPRSTLAVLKKHRRLERERNTKRRHHLRDSKKHRMK